MCIMWFGWNFINRRHHMLKGPREKYNNYNIMHISSIIPAGITLASIIGIPIYEIMQNNLNRISSHILIG